MKRKISLLLILALMLVAFAGCGGETAAVSEEEERYEEAEELMEDGSYQEAAEIFEDLGDYEDSEELAQECKYLYAGSLMEAGDYAAAIEIYTELEDYEDSEEKLAEAQQLLQYAQYSPVYEALCAGVWFYEADTVNSVCVLTFTQDAASVKEIYYDGNGPHTTSPVGGAYQVDDHKITVTLEDGTSMEISYTMDNGLELGTGYFTPEEIEAGLEGYWGIESSSYNAYTGYSESEYIFYFEDGELAYEHANTAYGYSDGTYYYYGPYEGTYYVDASGMVVDARNSWQFGFVISEGKVAMCRCGDVLSPYDGFKGQYGFDFT